jgi:hypothetical protein
MHNVASRQNESPELFYRGDRGKMRGDLAGGCLLMAAEDMFHQVS